MFGCLRARDTFRATLDTMEPFNLSIASSADSLFSKVTKPQFFSNSEDMLTIVPKLAQAFFKISSDSP